MIREGIFVAFSVEGEPVDGDLAVSEVEVRVWHEDGGPVRTHVTLSGLVVDSDGWGGWFDIEHRRAVSAVEHPELRRLIERRLRKADVDGLGEEAARL